MQTSSEAMEKTVVGFLGCGNIGGGVYALLNQEAERIAHSDGVGFRVKRALVRDLEKTRKYMFPEGFFTTDPDEVLMDPEISIVVEFLGGEHPAYEYMLRALRSGKTVVTANKEALAKHWHELQTAAHQSGAGLYYEASVAGGIPILRTLTDSLQVNRIDSLYGIINGTTNYMLSEMTGKGIGYAEALAQAQELGLAEPDPTSDVDGFDAAYKLSILATIAFHARVPVDRVFREGIRSLEAEDMQAASGLGYTIKLLGIAKREGDEVEIRVHPTLLPAHHPLATVSGAYNAIYLSGHAVGNLMLYGRGAGEMPTASAVVSDLVVAATRLQHRLPTFDNQETPPEELHFVANWRGCYYLRLTVQDRPGVMSAVTGIMGACNVSIQSMMQTAHGGQFAPLVFITHLANEQDMQKAVRMLNELEQVVRVDNLLRVEGLL